MDETVWTAKLHGESVYLIKNPKKKVISMPIGKGFFADKICEKINFCQKWLPPTMIEKLKTENEIEAVFY